MAAIPKVKSAIIKEIPIMPRMKYTNPFTNSTMISPNERPPFLAIVPASAPKTFPLSLATSAASLPNFCTLSCTPFISSTTDALIVFISTFSPFISNFSAVVFACGNTSHSIM